MRGWKSIVTAAVLTVLLPLSVVGQARVKLPARDVPLALTASTVYSVGTDDGQEWETFGGVFSVAFDAAGNLHVLDAGAQKIHVFDTNGKHVRSIGRRGNGPGEFSGAVGMDVGPDGHLIVNDMARQGFQVLSPDGQHVRTIDSVDGTRVMGRVRAHPRGGAVGVTRYLNLRMNAPPTEQPSRSVTWLAPEGPRRLYTMPPQPAVQATQGPQQPGQLVAIGARGFAPRLQWALLPDGIVAGHTAEYTLSVASFDGAIQHVIERPIRPRKVTQRDRDRLNERRRSGSSVVVSVGKASGATSFSPPPVTEFEEVIPVISGLAADPEGRIWVQRGEEDEAVVDVITAQGRYLGTVAGDVLPDAFGPDGRAAYIEHDDLGVQRVVVKVLQLAARSG